MSTSQQDMLDCIISGIMLLVILFRHNNEASMACCMHYHLALCRPMTIKSIYQYALRTDTKYYAHILPHNICLIYFLVFRTTAPRSSSSTRGRGPPAPCPSATAAATGDSLSITYLRNMLISNTSATARTTPAATAAGTRTPATWATTTPPSCTTASPRE